MINLPSANFVTSWRYVQSIGPTLVLNPNTNGVSTSRENVRCCDPQSLLHALFSKFCTSPVKVKSNFELLEYYIWYTSNSLCPLSLWSYCSNTQGEAQTDQTTRTSYRTSNPTLHNHGWALWHALRAWSHSPPLYCSLLWFNITWLIRKQGKDRVLVSNIVGYHQWYPGACGASQHHLMERAVWNMNMEECDPIKIYVNPQLVSSHLKPFGRKS